MKGLHPNDLGMEGPHKYTCTGDNPYSPQWIKKLKKFLEENDNIFLSIFEAHRVLWD